MNYSRDVQKNKVPFVPNESALLFYPSEAVDPVQWDQVGDVLNTPVIESKVWQAAILESISVSLEELANPDDGQVIKVELQDLVDLFPKIDVRRFKIPTWDILVNSLPNVENVAGGQVTLKALPKVAPRQQTQKSNLRVELIVEGQMLRRLSEMGQKGPRSASVNIHALERLILSKFEKAQIVSRTYINCRTEASDPETGRQEAFLSGAGFEMIIHPANKDKAAQTSMWSHCKNALGSPKTQVLALLSDNNNLLRRVQDLENSGKPVLLLTCNQGVNPRVGNVACVSNRLAKAASQVIWLDKIAAKPHAKNRFEDDVFSENGN
jgi:hypothetical protein